MCDGDPEEPLLQSGRRHPHRLARADYARPGTVIFVTFCRKPEFDLNKPHVCASIVDAAARMGSAYGLQVEAYCIMPDHVHLAMRVLSRSSQFEKWMRYTKRESQRAVGIDRLWQRSCWDVSAATEGAARAMIQYILENPVRKRLCSRCEQWAYSWARSNGETQGANPGECE